MDSTHRAVFEVRMALESAYCIAVDASRANGLSRRERRSLEKIANGAMDLRDDMLPILADVAQRTKSKGK